MYKKVLWATDLSEESVQALEYAVPILKKMDSEIYVLSVVPYTPFLYSSLLGESAIYAELLEEIVNETKEDLKKLIEELKSRYDIRIARWEVVVGSPYAEVIEHARRKGVDLILMGSRGKGRIEEFLIGSTAKKVVAKSDRDLLLVRKKKGYEKALICVDLSESSKVVMEKGKKFASIVGMDYTLFHVIESDTPLPESIQRENRGKARATSGGESHNRVLSQSLHGDNREVEGIRCGNSREQGAQSIRKAVSGKHSGEGCIPCSFSCTHHSN